MTKLTLASFLVVSSAFAQVVVPWTAQTTPVPSTLAGDPTFARFPPGLLPNVRIVGTDTAMNGAYVWDLSGQSTQVLSTGLSKSSDARNGLVVVASPNSGVYFFTTTAGVLVPLFPNLVVPTANQLTLGSLADGGYELWVDTSSQVVEHFELAALDDGGLVSFPLPAVTLPEPPSGLALDEVSRVLYAGQPNLGVVAVSDGGVRFAISIDAGTLGPQVGGLDVYLSGRGGRLLFSTSATTDEVKVHDLASGALLATLQFGPPDAGAARVRSPRYLDSFDELISGRSTGLLVVQDGISGSYSLIDLDAVSAAAPALAPDLKVRGAPVDAGTPTDGGTSTDAGTGGGSGSDGGAGGGGGTTGTPGGAAPGSNFPSPGCGCTDAPFAILPTLLLLWFSRRLRSSPHRS